MVNTRELDIEEESVSSQAKRHGHVSQVLSELGLELVVHFTRYFHGVGIEHEFFQDQVTGFSARIWSVHRRVVETRGWHHMVTLTQLTNPQFYFSSSYTIYQFAFYLILFYTITLFYMVEKTAVLWRVE